MIFFQHRLCFHAMLLTVLYIRVNGQCSSRQFKCGDGKCIPLSWECDGEHDCTDRSDEAKCEARTCRNTEFSCADGKCVPSRWQCDGESDCTDNSDENPVVCRQKTCSSTEFACKSTPGVCIPINWHCDNTADCLDGSDEKDNCEQVTCSEEEFTCNNNKCITKRWVCDRDNDCGDSSDEINCPNATCSSGEFMCNTGKCIPGRWQCDGSEDCTDSSDEQNCPSTISPSVCSAREFLCANNRDCIHTAWQCDGDKDCPDGSDEVNCNNTCRPDHFQCKNLHCIPGILQCNGKKECPDGSDEENCEGLRSAKCDPNKQFDCGGNHCIPLHLVCNGENDCGDYEDEPRDLCHEDECKISNGNCSQICRDLVIDYRCECRTGYKLVNNYTCDDIDECEIPGFCSQICHNTKGGFKCDCLPGYNLEPSNFRRCRVSENHPVLMFANRHDIRKIDLETSEYLSVISNLHSTVAIDYEFRTGTIFWSDVVEEAIKSAPIDTGTPVNTIVSDSIVTVDGIAVDWIYSHIYWTDTGKNSIEMADKPGKMRKTLINTNLDEPRAIVLNPVDGWMYWSDWGEPAKIERAGMDGSHRSIIISSDIKWPNGLAIDFVSKKIFWADAKLHTLSSADFNGDNQKVISSSPTMLKHPFSIDVFEDWVYWTDWESEGIHRVNKFNGQERKDIATGIFSPMDIHIYHHFKQPEGVNYCNNLNGRCSHFCLPSPNITSHSARYTCACPDGMILTDKSTCIPKVDGSTSTHVSAAVPLSNLTTSITNPSVTEQTTVLSSTGPKLYIHESAAIPTVVSTEAADIGDLLTYSSVDKSETNLSAYNNSSKIHFEMTKTWQSGKLAGVIIGGLLGLLLIVVFVSVLLYNHYKRKNVTSMNFDNPVYRKTTEDQFSLEKNQYQPARSYPPSLEPLTSPGTNEFV